MVAFDSDDPSMDLAQVYSFYVKFCLQRTKKQKEMPIKDVNKCIRTVNLGMVYEAPAPPTLPQPLPAM